MTTPDYRVIDAALSDVIELTASQSGRPRREIEQELLMSWASPDREERARALSQVRRQLGCDTPTPAQQRRLARSGLDQSDLIEFSQASIEQALAADDEVSDADVQLTYQSLAERFPKIMDLDKALAGPCTTVAMSHRQRHRQFDEYESLPARSQSEIDAYALKLAREGEPGSRALGLTQTDERPAAPKAGTRQSEIDRLAEVARKLRR